MTKGNSHQGRWAILCSWRTITCTVYSALLWKSRLHGIRLPLGVWGFRSIQKIPLQAVSQSLKSSKILHCPNIITPLLHPRRGTRTQSYVLRGQTSAGTTTRQYVKRKLVKLLFCLLFWWSSQGVTLLAILKEKLLSLGRILWASPDWFPYILVLPVWSRTSPSSNTGDSSVHSERVLCGLASFRSGGESVAFLSKKEQRRKHLFWRSLVEWEEASCSPIRSCFRSW